MSQLYQLLGKMWSYYNGKWFLSRHFVFRSSGKLKSGLSTYMTYYFILQGFQSHRSSL